MKLIFITGSSGIGKSTLVPLLKSALPDFDIHDFDERLTNEIARDNRLLDNWRKKTTEYWIRFTETNARSTIVLGLIYPREASAVHSEIPIEFILLDASDHVIKERLMNKRFSTPEKIAGLKQATGLTPEEFIESNKALMEKLRLETKQFGGTILDTTNNSPEETVEKLKIY